jgi:putative tryptophan/tyrosine transport system substrate-binding protein
VPMRRIGLAVVIALVLAPFAAEGQRAGKVPHIGYLSLLSAARDSPNMEAFRQGLRDLGYVEGKTALIDARYADGKLEMLPNLAAEIVRLNVDVIVAAPTPAVRAVQQATRTIPIVMAFSGDPVGEGFATGLARPGGNITGHSAAVAEMSAKRVEFLKSLVPKLSHVALLTPLDGVRAIVSGTEGAARSLGLQVSTTLVRNPSDVDHAFSSMPGAHVGGVIVDLALRQHQKQILALALKSRLPTISGPREFVEAGGLVAYGPNFPDLFRRSAAYVDKILKGAKPADLPIEQPTKFDLVVNLKTAKALGLTVPRTVILQADQVIE